MYLGEFRQHWRVFLSACLGMGLGSAFSHYTASLFGPPLLAEFGWTKAEFALLGTFTLINLIFVPIAGRIVDRFGTRPAAMIGFTVLPFGYLAFTVMSGEIVHYFAIWVLIHIFSIFTTTIVFARMIIEKFDRARGLALSLVLTSAPFFSMFGVPLLGTLIEAEGWRAGYVALAVLCAVGGWTSIAMMDRPADATADKAAVQPLTRRDLAELLRNPTLLLFLLAMFLVNIPQSFGTSQLKLVLMDGGHSSATATWMMSLYAGGVIVGRILSGLALDRLPAHLVALAILGLPTVGYLLLAGHVSAMALLCLAVGVIGFAQGAETDIGAFLLSRRFDNRNFSLLISLMSAMIGVGSAAGSIVMSTTLQGGGSYLPFLWLSAAGTLVGAVLFSLAGRKRADAGETAASGEPRPATP